MKQKIWLYIFPGMFLVPEILWSPLWNIIDSFLQNSNNIEIFRPNFLTDIDNYNSLLVVLTIQVIGVLGVLILIYKTKLKILLKSLLFLILLLLFIVSGLILYTAFYMRHGIGF